MKHLFKNAEAIASAIGTLVIVAFLVILIAIVFAPGVVATVMNFIAIITLSVSGMVFVAGLIWLVAFGGDKLMVTLCTVEQWQQERARSAQEWAIVARIESEARVNDASAIASMTVVQQVTPSRDALIIRGNEVQRVTKLSDVADEAIALPPPDFEIRKVFKNTVQTYAIIGGQQTGKTWQARHIASDWQRRGAEVWFVGPKWNKDEWCNCKMFGGRLDYEAVSEGLARLQAEAQRRHNDSSKDHKDHPLLVAILDDWTPVVENCDNAISFVYDATTLFASVNIILIFLVHADTADAWGVSKKGAALKENFVKAYIIPFYNSDGEVVRDKTTADVYFPGTDGRKPLKLDNSPIDWTPVPPVPGNDKPVPDHVPHPFPSVPVPKSERIQERYIGQDLEIALAILKGWSKTKTRQNVTGRYSEIGHRYDEIQAELEAANSHPQETRKPAVLKLNITGNPQQNGEVLH